MVISLFTEWCFIEEMVEQSKEGWESSWREDQETLGGGECFFRSLIHWFISMHSGVFRQEHHRLRRKCVNWWTNGRPLKKTARRLWRNSEKLTATSVSDLKGYWTTCLKQFIFYSVEIPWCCRPGGQLWARGDSAVGWAADTSHSSSQPKHSPAGRDLAIAQGLHCITFMTDV